LEDEETGPTQATAEYKESPHDPMLTGGSRSGGGAVVVCSMDAEKVNNRASVDGHNHCS